MASAIMANAAELTAKENTIIDIGAWTARGEQDKLGAAFKAGFGAGLTLNEAKELVGQLYAYCGFPRALNAAGTLMKLAQDRDAAGTPVPAGEPEPEDRVRAIELLDRAGMYPEAVEWIIANGTANLSSQFLTSVALGAGEMAQEDEALETKAGRIAWAAFERGESGREILELILTTGFVGFGLCLAWLILILRDSWRMFFVRKEKTIFLCLPVIVLSLLLANMFEAMLLFYMRLAGYVFFFTAGCIHSLPRIGTK